MSDVDLKVVLLGKEYCGKTSLVERFINDRFTGENRYQNTIGAAYGARRVHIDADRAVAMGVWDTAGSERYEAISRIYYRGAAAAVVCYDVTDADSWSRLSFWVRELRKHEEACKIYLCATKTDLLGGRQRRAVDFHETTDFADEIGAQVFETSSKTGENVDSLFLTIAIDFAADPRNASSASCVQLESKSAAKSSASCCVIT